MSRLIDIVKEQWRVILVTVVVTLGILVVVIGGEKVLSSTTFCLSCHSMSYNAEELKESGHYGSLGVNPECKDCHLPPNFFKRLESHLIDGTRAVIGELTKDLSTKEKFDEYRLEFAHNARMNLKRWDSASCRVCHKTPMPPTDEGAAQHKKMETEGKTCIDCHQNLVHEAVQEEDLDQALKLGKFVPKPEEDEEDSEDSEE